MKNVSDVVTSSLVVILSVLLLVFAAPRPVWAQALLENPGAGSFQSGVGVVSGWACDATRVEIVFDDAQPHRAGYGTTRGDTRGACGDDDNGFSLLWNWNLLGDGPHTVRALIDGVEIGRATFTVTAPGGEFLRGAAGSCTAGDFPQQGKNVTLEWEQSLQNFVVTGVGEDGGGGGSETFRTPPEIVSAGGALNATLTADEQQVTLADQTVTARVYNGLYTPPTLRVRPGDVMNIQITNALSDPTNLHHHGSNVSPLGNGDNVFSHIMPGETFAQRITFPAQHAPGFLWYHPHMHGLVESQIFGGLSGGLIVEGMLDPFPQLQGITERVMLLKDFQVDAGGRILADDIDSNAGTTRTVNGVVNPTLMIHPGETQFWRLGNVGADIYYLLKLDGHTLHEIAQDGNRHNQLVPREQVLVPPAGRVEVLVQGGPAGIYQLRTLPVNTGPQGDQYPEVTLATLIAQGRAQTPLALPATEEFPPVEDLRTKPTATSRTFVFSESDDGNSFFINGKMFDEDRVDTTVKLGSVEEWTIQNVSQEMHVFHIHQLDFQVTEIDGERQDFVGHQDIVNLPPQSTVKVLIPFTNPVIVGKFVYHCHIVAHEDNGMMAVVEVTP